MSVTDPIADMLTRIRNAVLVEHDSVSIPSSQMKTSIAQLLSDEGFIQGFELGSDEEPQREIKLFLHYHDDGAPAIVGLKRVSRPGLRVYVRKGEIPRYFGGLGVSILSTSQGVMTGQNAWKKGVGGELLCYVW